MVNAVEFQFGYLHDSRAVAYHPSQSLTTIHASTTMMLTR